MITYSFNSFIKILTQSLQNHAPCSCTEKNSIVKITISIVADNTEALPAQIMQRDQRFWLNWRPVQFCATDDMEASQEFDPEPPSNGRFRERTTSIPTNFRKHHWISSKIWFLCTNQIGAINRATELNKIGHSLFGSAKNSIPWLRICHLLGSLGRNLCVIWGILYFCVLVS